MDARHLLPGPPERCLDRDEFVTAICVSGLLSQDGPLGKVDDGPSAAPALSSVDHLQVRGRGHLIVLVPFVVFACPSKVELVLPDRRPSWCCQIAAAAGWMLEENMDLARTRTRRSPCLLFVS